MGATSINSAKIQMNSYDIKSIKDLREYMNQSEEYPTDIQDIIQKYKWVDFNGYNKHPEYICTDGDYLLIRSEKGVEICSLLENDLIEKILEEIMQSTDIRNSDCELRIFDQLRRLQLHSNRRRLGERIEKLRTMKGLKQNELAEASGIDRTNVAKIENGRYNASFDILSKIAKALGCEIDLVTEEECDILENIRQQKVAKAAFTYYDAENQNIKVFGDWAVNECGDIINYKMYYPLYNYTLTPYGYDEEQSLSYWYNHISEKYDYDIEHFTKAFRYAMTVIKENAEKGIYITNLKKFIANNKDRDDMVGDLCSDLMRDKEFKSLHTEDEQQEFIMIVGNIHEHIQDAIIQLFKEYSGEEVVFEEEEEEEEEWI